MKQMTLSGFVLWALFACMGIQVSVAIAQETKEQQPSKPEVENITPEDFTQLLKQVWTFLKDETVKYSNATQGKSEFETTSDFNRKVTDFRGQYISNVIKFSREQKLPQRTFAIPFKATLNKYDADAQLYSLLSRGTIEAPYNIPTVQCVVPSNPYLALGDSIREGYRISTLFLNLKPDFKLQMVRDAAKAAKMDEGDIYFRVNAVIDIEASKDPSQAQLSVIPKRIELVNTKTNKIFWEENFR